MRKEDEYILGEYEEYLKICKIAKEVPKSGFGCITEWLNHTTDIARAHGFRSAREMKENLLWKTLLIKLA